MKSIFTLFFLVVSASLILAQPNDDEKERIRISESKIKTIIQWTHRFSQGKPNPSGYKTTETHYDKNGNPIEIINYRSNGEISSRLLYKYNDKNLRTEYLMYQKDGKDFKLTFKQTFHYNAKGLKTHEVVFDGVSGYRITYEYLPNNELKEIVKFGSNNTVDERWVYSYKNNIQEISIFKPDKVLNSIVRKTYDAKGNLVEDLRLDSKGNEQKKVTYSFDSKNRMIEMSESFSGKLSKRLEYKFNDTNLVSEVAQENSDGTKFTQSIYSYDSNGSLIEERWSESKADEFSLKQSSYNTEGNVVETDSYFAPYRYRVLYKYTYDYFK